MSGTGSGKKKTVFGMLCVLIPAAAVLFLNGLDVSSVVLKTGDTFLSGIYLVLLLLLAGILLVSRTVIRKSGRYPEKAFFLTGLLLGLIFMLIMPGLSAPDEGCHYITAYSLSSEIMGKAASDPKGSGRVPVRAKDYPLEDLKEAGVSGTTPEGTERQALGAPVKEESYRIIRDWDRLYAGRNGTVLSFEPPVRTAKLVYLPQALGFTLARALNLNALWLLFFGKFLNLLAYLALTAFAIRLTPFGKELFFATGLLPMVLHLTASLSYDTMILGVVFLLTAVILRLAYQAERVVVKDMILLCILIAFIGPCKMVYSPIILLFLLIPQKKFGYGWKKLLCFLAFAAALAVSMFAVNASVISSYASAAPETATVQIGKQGYSVIELLHRPVFIVQLLYRTFLTQAGIFCLGMAGSWLGNMDPVMGAPVFVSVTMLVLLPVLSLKKPGEIQKMSGIDRVWSGLIVLAVVLLTAGAMLVAWTTRESNTIEGIQGRYLLPVLPLLLMLLKNDRIVLTADRTREILFSMVCLDAYVAVQLYATACLRL